MESLEILKKLNNHNNFHLTLKVIEISNDLLLDSIASFINAQNKTTQVITSKKKCFDLLYFAYINKIDYVLVNQNIDFLLPLVSIIYKDELTLIKPMIPILYLTKDNKIAEEIKKNCRKKMTTFQYIKNNDELFNYILLLM